MEQGQFGQYSEKVMEHFRNPRNVGEIPDADGIGNVGNPVCGDIMRLYIKVENDKIIDAKFKTFGCLPEDEEVVSSANGWQKISTIDKGLKVLDSDGKENQIVETYVRNYKGPLLKIVPFISPFNAFYLTPNHPVYCIKRKLLVKSRRYNSRCDWLQIDKEEIRNTKPTFVKAEELEEGDYLIFVPNRAIVDNDKYPLEIMALIGYYLSEGYIVAKGRAVAFAFNRKEKDAIAEVESLIFKITGKAAKKRMRGNVAEVYACSKKLADFLSKVAGRHAREKSLSNEIMLLPFSKHWEMLNTYLLGDGDSYRRRPKDTKTYRIITTSKKLAVQIQQILARWNIFASIREIYKSNCMIDGRKLKDSTQYLISFKLFKRHSFIHLNSRNFLVPIREIKMKDFYGKVYNFQVAFGPNTYLVKGFAVHNCGAAISTSSMVTELVKGKTVDEALKISNRAVAEALGGLPPIKMHCSVLAEEALKAAIEDYLKKK